MPAGGEAIASTVGPDLVPGARNFPVTTIAASFGSPSSEIEAAPVINAGPPAINPAGSLASRIVAAEGGPGKNPASSADGFGQFLRGTWLDLFSRAYPVVARKLSTEQILALRDVKPLAVDLASQYAHENAETLSRQGVLATDAVLSLAHAVGPAGAASIVSAPSTRPVRELLGRKAIAANPLFATMTAGSLRQWAAYRAAAGDITERAIYAPPPPANPVLTMAPSEDFHIGGGKMASEELRANQTRIADLKRAVAALSAAKDRVDAAPGEKRSANQELDKVAVEAVFTGMRALANRPGNERLKYFLKYSTQPEQVRPSVLRDLALVVIGKLQEETEVLVYRERQGRR